MFRQHAQQRHRQLNEIDDALADSGTYGICSTFYTNNPLLYASHFAQLDASDLRQDETWPNDASYSRKSSKTTIHSSHAVHHILPVSDTAIDPLVSRRHAVEMLCLDRSLVDYLVQNGVIDQSLQQQLIDVSSSSSPGDRAVVTSLARRNLMVLKCVDAAGRRGFDLFLNALRHTCQHTLANLLDVSRRIEPADRQSEQISGNIRRKGQVKVNILVASVRLFHAMNIESGLNESSDETLHDWISLDDVDRKLQALTSRKVDATRRGHVTRHRRPVHVLSGNIGIAKHGIPQIESAATKPEVVDIAGKKQQLLGRLVTWMTSGWQRGRSSRHLIVADSDDGVPSVTGSRPATSASGSKPNDVIDQQLTIISDAGKLQVPSSTSGYFRMQRDDGTPSLLRPAPTSNSDVGGVDAVRTVRQRQSIDKLRRAADCVRVASQEFYSALTGNTMFGDVSQSRDRLLRYFEAERRMLVLDTLIVDVPNGDCGSFRTNSSCLSVVVICPTLKHLESLRLDCSSGQLRDDLEQRLLTADLIDELNAEVDAVRLEVQLDVDDVELAQSDFQQ